MDADAHVVGLSCTIRSSERRSSWLLDKVEYAHRTSSPERIFGMKIKIWSRNASKPNRDDTIHESLRPHHRSRNSLALNNMTVDPACSTANTGNADSSGEGGRLLSDLTTSIGRIEGVRDSDVTFGIPAEDGHTTDKSEGTKKLSDGHYRTQCLRCDAIVYDGSWISPPQRRDLHEQHRATCPSPAVGTEASTHDLKVTAPALSIVSTGHSTVS